MHGSDCVGRLELSAEPYVATVVKGAGSGSTAFTGGDVSVVGIALVVLVALGLIALIASRFWPERNSGSHFRV